MTHELFQTSANASKLGRYSQPSTVMEVSLAEPTTAPATETNKASSRRTPGTATQAYKLIAREVVNIRRDVKA
jgi:hypothetical protein